MPTLQQQIDEASTLLRELRAENRECKRIAKKSLRGRGRKPLPTELIERARELAKTRPLTTVALSLGISLRSLYNKAIDAEKAIQIDCEENLM